MSNSVTPDSVIENIAGRISSDTWEVPDAIMQPSVGELRTWAGQIYGDLSQPQTVERLFSLDLTRFTASD
jgi:hypothetical protein